MKDNYQIKLKKITGQPVDADVPLVVDLDRTFIHTDLLYEAIIGLIKKNPLYIFNLFAWALKGKAFLKNKIFSLVPVNAELLPYNASLIDFLKEEAATGRPLVMATATPLKTAFSITKRYPFFSQVFGTENNINLKGEDKSKILIEKFGEGNFDYVGDSRADLAVFAHCRNAYLVNPSKWLQHKTSAVSNLAFVWNFEANSLKQYLKAMRLYQWIKNLLLFVPLLTAHVFISFNLLLLTLTAFISFSLVASAGYLINDLMDINADRAHPRKRFRPLASGKISVKGVVALTGILLAAGILFALQISFVFFIILSGYFLLSIAYSLFLKKIILYDVFILAILYSIRVFAGGAVAGITLSFWLIAFSVFIFLSLAFVKRCAELIQIGTDTKLKIMGRGYVVDDISLLQIMGVGCGFLSVVVFALYINSPDVMRLYTDPKILWGISFLFLFWISRMWLYTIRGKMTDDPIIFALKDITSYFIFFLIALFIVLAK